MSVCVSEQKEKSTTIRRDEILLFSHHNLNDETQRTKQIKWMSTTRLLSCSHNYLSVYTHTHIHRIQISLFLFSRSSDLHSIDRKRESNIPFFFLLLHHHRSFFPTCLIVFCCLFYSYKIARKRTMMLTTDAVVSASSFDR